MIVKKSNYIFFTKGERQFRARKIDGKIIEFQEHGKITEFRRYWHRVNIRYIQEVLDCYAKFMQKKQIKANQILQKAQET